MQMSEVDRAFAERSLVAREVERLLRGIQADLGFEGGVSTFENG